MRIAVGSDHAGFDLKKIIVEYLKTAGRSYEDFGVFSEESVDYPDLASAVVSGIMEGRCSCGILICGTGIGMSIAANKHKGVRAALCSESFSARFAREHNDANILVLGSRVIGPGLAVDIVESFLGSNFAGGRHGRRVDKISGLEQHR
jgi:ribose 5-phosphate isomerase B